MKLIKSTTWKQVFHDWQDRESHDPDWIKYATEVKGWPDWKSWREFTAQQVAALARKWQIFKFTDPLAEIPEMLAGPFNSWQSGVADKNKITFAELLARPDKYQKFSQNKKVTALIAALPFTTQLIGLRRADLDGAPRAYARGSVPHASSGGTLRSFAKEGKIICLEGHHRATAITLAKLQNKKIDFSDTAITIALADVPREETDLFDKVLARGTSKQ